MFLGLEIFFIGLLILTTLSIGYVSVIVLFNLFKGQR